MRYAKDNHEYAAKRFQEEVRRLYGVLERHLASSTTGTETEPRSFLVGNKCTIADISLWGWVSVSRWAGVELAEHFPLLMAWERRMLQRPALERGRHVPDPHHRELLQDAKAMKEFEERGKAFYRQKEAEASAAARAGEQKGNGRE